jgi:hypothetical protein
MSTYPVRQQYVSDTPVQLLNRPVSALLTVSPSAATLLNGDLGISTIFDLGASLLFGTARTITEAALGVQSVAGMPVSRDVIDEASANLTISELAESPVHVLRYVSDALAQSLNSTLGIETVRELAAWPPYGTARKIVNDAYGLVPEFQNDDPQRPADLVPVARQYATEQVQYDVLVLDRLLNPNSEIVNPDLVIGTDLILGNRRNPLDIRNAGGIDVADIVGATLMAQPAVGAILTYRQSWFPQGLALGHLLHSLALAPGESTRIAMVDWTRRVRASTDEVTAQIEALSASMERMRALSEVTSSVAREAQSGFSESASRATANQSGMTSGTARFSVDSRGPLAPIVGGELGSATASSMGVSSASSVNTGWASSRASSSGDRTLSAEMMQNVADRTQQAANSTRNRRATAVTESSQSESEQLSTRVVANYNHMHALTVLYFEVVQVYRVVLELARTTPALFLPMKLITFNENVIRRYRSVIAAAGLTPEVRNLALSRSNQLAIESPRRSGGWTPRYLVDLDRVFGSPVANQNDAIVYLPLQRLNFFGLGSFDQNFLDKFSGVAVTMTNGTRYAYPITDRAETGNAYTGQFVASLTNNGLNARDIARIDLIQKNADFEGSVELIFSFDGEQPNGQALSNVLDIPGLALGVTVQCQRETVTPAFVMAPALNSNELMDHLEENALHYSTAIWRSLDAATITTLLSTYTLDGGRLIESIDPVPVTITGNYLVFRFYGMVTENCENLRERLGTREAPREDMVPLPSGGVFAEAVLGRSNSAEKLDITRFWNWQDSPIPILPSEINPLTAGGKANDNTPQTGSLEGSVVNIVNPPSLPDPTGLAPLYSAISSGNMFRDMSGLAQTSALVNAALQAAQAGAANATGAAGEAQRVAAQQLTDILKIAAQVALAAATGGAGGAAGAGLGAIGGALGSAAKPGVTNTPSNAGALINQGRSMDDRRLTDSLPPSSAGSVTPSSDPADEWLPFPGGSSGNGSTTAGTTSNGGGASRNLQEAKATDVALTGGGGGPLGFIQSILGAIPGGIPTAPVGPSNITDPKGRQYVRQEVVNEARNDSRTAESLDYLSQLNWELRKTGFNAGSRRFWVDHQARQLLIDENDEDVITASKQLTAAVKLAFVEDDDLRRLHERQAATFKFFPGGQQDDLTAMGDFYNWASWFWTIDNNNGQVSPLIRDACAVLGGREPVLMLDTANQYYCFGVGRGRATNTGFNTKFQDDSNQVRHAAASLNGSYHVIGGYSYLQFRELRDGLVGDQDAQNAALADISLNYYLQELSEEIKNLRITGTALGSAIVTKLR